VSDAGDGAATLANIKPEATVRRPPHWKAGSGGWNWSGARSAGVADGKHPEIERLASSAPRMRVSGSGRQLERARNSLAPPAPARP
jgi:hypothetical protein